MRSGSDGDELGGWEDLYFGADRALDGTRVASHPWRSSFTIIYCNGDGGSPAGADRKDGDGPV